MSGRQRIEAPRADVWAALNEPDILRRCIPGCRTLEKLADDRMKATVVIKIGPIGATFSGNVTLSDLDPPNGYRIQGEGSGGPAGFAQGGADVRLTADGAQATWLDYQVTAQVGGKLAQLGGPLIDATAKQLSAQFFKTLAAVMAERGPPAHAPAMDKPVAVADAQPAPVSPDAVVPVSANDAPRSAATMAWGFASACAGLLGYILGRSADGWDAAGGWPGLAIGLAFIVVAGGAYTLGRADRQ